MQAADYRRIEKAILHLERNFPSRPGLAEVARAAGLSPCHFQRLFTRWAGISPKRFLQFLAAERARNSLRGSATVLDAAFEAGLSGPGRLHDLVVNVYAVTPRELKEEGAGLAIRYGMAPTPFGDCLLAATDRGICALSFPGEGREEEAVGDLRREWGNATLVADPETAGALARRIFDPARRADRSPLCAVVRGTNFQVRVWEALLRIPPGRTASYEAVAAAAGSPGAVRAAGSAVARNPVAFLIPCHRVIRKTGAFGNYHWGAGRKQAILAWEAARFRARDEGEDGGHVAEKKRQS